MKFLKKVAAATCAAVLVGGGLTACSSDSGSGADGNVIRAFSTEPQNPLVTTNTNETGGGKVLKLLYEGLVAYDAKGNIENALAEKIEANDDSTEFTITIKPDQKFSDGSPVTAQSFVDAWNFGAAAKNAQLQASFFEPIEGYDEVSAEGATADTMSGLEVVSDTEFTVKLKAPTSDFPKRLGYTAFMPLPESAMSDIDAFGENPIGNGPYKLAEDGWVHNESITLVPNENYDGPRKPANDGIEFRIYTSQDTAYLDLQGGQLDIADYTVPQQNFSTFESDFPDSNVTQPAAIFQSFTIPERLEHFSGEEGKLRRQAISMAIDRDQITETIFEGTRTPAVDFTTPAIEGGGKELPGSEVTSLDKEKAKELWQQADEIKPWSGTFEIAYNADGDHQQWVEAVTNQIRDVLGIEAQGKSYPTFKQIRDEVTGQTIQTAFRTGWQADYPSTMNFLEGLYRTGAASNDGKYSSEEFDKAIDAANAASSPEEAQPEIDKAQEILLEDLPAIPLWYSNVATAWNPDLKDVEYGWDSDPLYYKLTK